MIDPSRHQSIFNPEKFGDRRVDIIGAGATGSRIALSLAKLGITNICLWDADIVEEHNLANQVYVQSDIGKLKVEALHDLILQSTGVSVTMNKQMVEQPEQFGDVVFLLVDSMAARKQIWKQSLKLRINVKLMIETRMGPESGRVYAINPISPKDIKGWEGTLYSDEESTDSMCGASISVGPTAEVITGVAVWQFIRWFNIEQNKDQIGVDAETFLSLSPLFVSTSNFK